MKLRAVALFLFLAAAIWPITVKSVAQTASNEALVKDLQRGGYVIVMRHASSPRTTPDEKTANPDNVNRERQLDDSGRAAAIAMGKAFRQQKIPVGQVFSSPTYRALETLRLLQFPAPVTVAELGENGQSMQGVTDSQAAWLKHKVTEFPKGSNTVIVTHFPNMTQAFPQWTNGLADGEALIFGPNSRGGATLIARVKMEDWPKLQP